MARDRRPVPAWAKRKAFSIDDRNVKRIIEMMQKLPQAMRDVAYKKALGPPARIAARKVRALTPVDLNDGRTLGGTGRWSKVIREGGTSLNGRKWPEGKKSWGNMQKLHQAVKVKLISNKRSKRNPVALVGFDFLNFGQTVYFNHPWKGSSRAHHMWSTPTNPGPHRTKSKSDNWVERAGQESKAAMLSSFRKAFMKHYRKELDKIMPKS